MAGAPTEAPAAEPEVVEPVAPVAEPTEPASPEPQEETPEGEGAVTGQEGEGPSLADALKDITGDELDALVRALPEETRKSSAFLREVERRGEDRGRVRRTEEDQARQTVRDSFQEIVETGDLAERQLGQYMTAASEELDRLERMTADPDYLDPEKLKKTAGQLANAVRLNLPSFVEPIRMAERAKAGQQQRADVLRVLNEYAPTVGKITDEEFEPISKALYDDARSGKARGTELMMRLIADRHYQKGLAEGREKGLKDKQSDQALLDKVKDIQSLKNGTAPDLRGGVTSNLIRTHEATISRIAAGTHDDVDTAYWRKWSQGVT